MTKTDRMDRLLSQLPAEAPAQDLAQRVSLAIRSRHRRRLAARFGLSLALSAFGLWLCLPLIVNLPGSVDLAGSGVPILSGGIAASLTDIGDFLTAAWNGFTGVQSGLTAPITASVWLGLAVLALGAMLAVSPLLASTGGAYRKGTR